MNSLDGVIAGAVLSVALTIFAARLVRRRRAYLKACRQLEQIRVDIMNGERCAREYCDQASDVMSGAVAMPSYRMPTGTAALARSLRAAALLQIDEHQPIADWYDMAEQMNQAMDKDFAAVAKQKARHLLDRELRGHSRSELANDAISRAVSRLA